MGLKDSLIDAMTITSEAYPVPKSFAELEIKDFSSGAFPATVTSVDIPDQREQVDKKQNVRQCRVYAERSWAVRTAIDIHRNFVFRAKPDVTAIDYKQPFDAGIKKSIEDLLSQRMLEGDSYASIKEKILEDFFVVGYGAIELFVRNDTTPYDMSAFDAEKLGFVRKWNSRNKDRPRYYEIDSAQKAVRAFSDKHMMTIINRERTYDLPGLSKIGLSHVEVLCLTIEALLSGDSHLLTELRTPAPSGALSLGPELGPDVADKVRAKITNAAAQWAFIVFSGAKNPKFIPFKERDLKALDKQAWFVREVCSVFGLPTVALAQKLDTVQSNTDALLEEKAEGLKDSVLRIAQMENMEIVNKFGDPRKHNLQIIYPVLGRKDELKQAELLAIQLGGQQSWATINEARRASGLETVDNKAADDILINTSTGLVALSKLDDQLYSDQPPTGTPSQDPGKADATVPKK